MRHTGGWVKFWRKAALGDINSNYTRGGLFIALLAMANIQESTVSWRGKPRKLSRGQIATSMQELAQLGGIDIKTVARHLNYLSLRGTISLEKSSTGTLITLLNHECYSGVDAEGPTPSPCHRDDDRHAIGIHNEELKNKRRREERELKALSLPRLAKIWNEHSGGLPKVSKTNKARTQKANQRFEENSDADWVEIVERIAKSDFCNGKNDRGWKASFDWLLQPETHLKVAEGKYDNRLSLVGSKSLEEIAMEVFGGT